MSLSAAEIHYLPVTFNAATLHRALSTSLDYAERCEVLTERLVAQHQKLLCDPSLTSSARMREINARYRKTIETIDKVEFFAADFFPNKKAPADVVNAVVANTIGFDIWKEQICPWMDDDSKNAFHLLFQANRLTNMMHTCPNFFSDGRNRPLYPQAFINMMKFYSDFQDEIAAWKQNPYPANPLDIPLYANFINKVWPSCELFKHTLESAQRFSNFVEGRSMNFVPVSSARSL